MQNHHQDETTITCDKDNADTFVRTGEKMFQCGNLARAFEYFTMAININPNHAVAHNNLGVVYYQTGKKENALAHFKIAQKLDPKNPDIASKQASRNEAQ